MIYRILTPEERARSEEAINENLSKAHPDLPRRRVCLHIDRSVIRMPKNGYMIICDYCPSYAVVRFGGTWPDIEPLYYEDREI